MASLNELAGKIEADRAAAEELGGVLSATKDQVDQTVAAIGNLGAEGAATRMRLAADKIEEAESIRVTLQGSLVKAHFQVMSAIHGRMGPGAPGSGAIVPLTRTDPQTGAPRAGLDAVPPHFRQDPTPTGQDLLEPPRRKKGSMIFREAVGQGDKVEDATKALDKNFDVAWDAIFGEPSPAQAQKSAVAEMLSSHGPVVTEVPASKIGGGGAVMASFVASLVVAKTLQSAVRQFERISSWFRKGGNRGR